MFPLVLTGGVRDCLLVQYVYTYNFTMGEIDGVASSRK